MGARVLLGLGPQDFAKPNHSKISPNIVEAVYKVSDS